MQPPRARAAVLVVATLALALPAVGLVDADEELFTIDGARWGTSDAPEEAARGDRGVPLSVTIHNVHTADYASARAELLDSQGLEVTVPGGDVASRSEPFAAGSTWEPTFHVDLGDDLAAGDMVTVRIRLTAWRLASAEESTLSTEVRVSGRTEVSAAPVDPLLPGGEAVDAPVRVANQGDGATGAITMRLTPATGSGLVLAGDDTWTVPPLDAGGDAVLRVPLRTPSSAGPHALVATLRYTDAAGARVDAEHLLAFQVSGTTRGPLEVGLATASVAAGENATLAFSLRNAGPTAIDHLQLTIVAPAAGATIVAAADGGRLAAPARLEAGAVAKATASVRTALVATDFVALQVRAAYIAGGARDDVFDFAIPVESPVRLRLLSLEASEDELSGILVNTGTGTAYNPQISQGGSAPVLIEDLEPNEPASFRVPVAGAAPGPTTLDVAWNDERGGLHAATVAGDARAIRGAQTSDTPSAAWPLAAAGVALAALVRRRGG